MGWKLTLPLPGKIKKLEITIIGHNVQIMIWDSNNSTNFKHQWLEKPKYKVYQPGYQLKAQILFKKRSDKGNVYSHCN